MEETAKPEGEPVDAPMSIDDIVSEIATGEEGSNPDGVEAIVDELVNEAEGESDSEQEPETEDDATEPADDIAEEIEAGDPEEQTYTVKVNGEERQVPLGELLNGYSRTEDYKAKTAAVAEERRTIEAERSKVESEVSAKYANQLQEATNLFAQYDPILQEAKTLDWAALKKADPGAYLNAQEAVQTRLDAINQMNGHAQQLRQQNDQRQQEQLQQERAQRFDASADEIVKAMPELADEAKFTEFAGANVEFLKSAGFTGEEIVDVLDHRVLTLADKARKWDAQQAAQKSLPEKRVVARSAVKSLTSNGTGSRATKPRFPSNADRDAKGDWIANQILSEE